jgi:polyketide synthase Type III
MDKRMREHHSASTTSVGHPDVITPSSDRHGRRAYIAAVGSAFPPNAYTQAEIGELLGLDNRVVKKLLAAPHIQKRHLYLPERDVRTGRAPEESPVELHRKFRDGALDIGGRAVRAALADAALAPDAVDYLMCITTTGFMVPGLTSLLMRQLELRPDLQRADIVGMGCNAGLNGLNLVAQWAAGNPGKVALMVCCEVNSAIYVLDGSPRTGIVNSLFGDGAAAVVMIGRSPDELARAGAPRPRVLDFESLCIPEQWGAMRFDWDDRAGKWSFFLDRDIPYVVGFNAHRPVDRMLRRHGLARSDIKHWVMHTGGGAVIDSLKMSLGLEEHDVRHTRSVLREYGNISSGSFLVSLQRLLAEGRVAPGDRGVMMTMGPGTQLEAALLEF